MEQVSEMERKPQVMMPLLLCNLKGVAEMKTLLANHIGRLQLLAYSRDLTLVVSTLLDIIILPIVVVWLMLEIGVVMATMIATDAVLTVTAIVMATVFAVEAAEMVEAVLAAKEVLPATAVMTEMVMAATLAAVRGPFDSITDVGMETVGDRRFQDGLWTRMVSNWFNRSHEEE